MRCIETSIFKRDISKRNSLTTTWDVLKLIARYKPICQTYSLTTTWDVLKRTLTDVTNIAENV